SIPAKCAESERLDSPPASFMRVVHSRKPHFKRSSAEPEPVLARRRNHCDLLVTQCCVEIKMTNSLQNRLLQKPFLDPHECRVIVLHSDHHGGLKDDPVPDSLRHRPQPDAQAADDHQK